LKLTITVMSMSGWTSVASGGRQQVLILATTSAMVFTCAGCADTGVNPASQNPTAHIKSNR